MPLLPGPLYGSTQRQRRGEAGDLEATGEEKEEEEKEVYDANVSSHTHAQEVSTPPSTSSSSSLYVSMGTLLFSIPAIIGA